MGAHAHSEPTSEASDRAERARRIFLGAHDMPWRSRAECKGEDPAIFWTPRLDEARVICGRCEVRDDCLAHALEVNEPGGIWGGMSVKERNKLRKGLPVVRMCAWCRDDFFFTPKPGRPSAYCSEACTNASRYVAKVDSKRNTGAIKNVGVMELKGHGSISRYHAGCRCVSCRRAARMARANARRAG